MWAKVILVMALIIGGQWAHGQTPLPPLNQPPLNIVASIRPIALISQEILRGIPATITLLLPASATPHDYGLKPSDLLALKQADWVIWLGATAEPYLKTVISSADHSLAWETLPGIKRLELREAGLQADSHNHHHKGALYDPHLWLSVDNALVLAQALGDSLATQYPALTPQLKANIKNLTGQLIQLRQTTKAQLDKGHPVSFLLAHDAFQYVELDLGLEALGSVMIDPEVKPGAKHLLQLQRLVQQKGVGCVFTDPTVSTQLVSKIIGSDTINTASIHPLAWDAEVSQYSEWLQGVYLKVTDCLLVD